MANLIKAIAFISMVIQNVAGQECPSVDWNNITSLVNALNISVSCDPTSIEVSIDACILYEVGFRPEIDLTINGIGNISSPCDSLSVNVSGDYWIATLRTLTDCNTEINVTDRQTINYYNEISTLGFSNLNNDTIVRRRDLKLPFVCEYEKVYSDMPTNGELYVEQEYAIAPLEEFTGEFDYTILLCLDQECHSPIQPGQEITILTPVYIYINTTRNVTVFIQDLEATSNASLTAKYKHWIVMNYCVTSDEEMAGTTMDIQSYVTVVCVEMFQWVERHLPTYFHVLLEFCDSAVHSCTNPCMQLERRRRRDVASLDDNTVTEVIGPWYTVSP